VANPAETRLNRAAVERALIAVGLVVFFLCLPFEISSDGRLRYMDLGTLIEGPELRVRGERVADLSPQDRQRILSCSRIGPLFSAPLWYLGKVWRSPSYWLARYNFFVFTLGLLGMHALLRPSVDPALLRRFLLLLIAGSMFPYHLREYLAEVFTSVFAAVGMVAVYTGRGALGWPLIVLAVGNSPACALGLAAVVAVCALRSRRWRCVLALPCAAGLILLEAWLRRGSPLATGYEGNAGFRTVLPYSGLPGFSYPLFFGVLAILLSFGKGLAWFAPGLALSWTGEMKKAPEPWAGVQRLWLWFLAGMIPVYAKWWAWYGGRFWGPRFFLFASIPACAALAAHLRPRNLSPGLKAAVLAALTLSVWVGLNGATFGDANLDVCWHDDYRLEHLCWHTPEFSVLWRPFTADARHRWLPLFAGGRLHPAPLALGLYFLAVYLYLAGPLWAGLTRDIAALGAKFVAERLNFRTWRF